MRNFRENLVKILKSPIFLFTYICLIPVIYAGLYQNRREEDLLFCFFNAALFAFPLYFMKAKRIYIVVVSLMLLLPAVFDLFHLYLYNNRITLNTFFILFDTNIAEANEYLLSNMSISFIAILCGFLFTYGFLLKTTLKHSNPSPINYRKGLVFFSAWVLAPILIKLITTSGSVQTVYDTYARANQLWGITSSYIKYNQELALFRDINSNIRDVGNVTYTKQQAEHSNYVLVIGESQIRRTMSLYGYHRNTNPLLNEIKSELLMFENVVNSTPPGTMMNLKKINSFANTENMSEELLGTTLINVMKKAGFKTYWLSNQPQLGRADTSTSVFAKQADTTVFLNSGDGSSYDEKILPIFKKYLDDPASKKFFIIHLLGSHQEYRRRYPDNFKKFTTSDDIDKKPFHNERSLRLINEYDNATLYNDYIVSSIIKILKLKDTASSMVYTSDHGEEVFYSKNLNGHPLEADTLDLYEIPMIMWTSSKEKKRISDVKFDPLLPYCTDDLIHTLLDLYGISVEKYDPTKSLINPNYQKKHTYYDKLLKTKKYTVH